MGMGRLGKSRERDGGQGGGGGDQEEGKRGDLEGKEDRKGQK